MTVPVSPVEIDRGVSRLPVPACDIHVAIEPVCGWRWVHEQLTALGMQVTVANPLKTRLIADSRLKCDSIDAQMLAELLRADFLPSSYVAPPNVYHLRSIVRHRTYLVQLRTGIKNRIKGVVTAMGLHALIDTCLTEKARASINLHPELKSMFDLMVELTRVIKPIDRALEKMTKEHATAKLLRTIPVVGAVTAATIMAEVGDFGRFRTPEQLASYAGLVPSQRSSGSYVKFGRITKIGSKYLRCACVESAMRLRASNAPDLYAFYERVKKEHSPMKARVACARKLITIMWHMVKNNEAFVPVRTAQCG
jgi:transposase